MSPATSWTEASVTGTGWQEAVSETGYSASTDYFIDPMFEGTAFFNNLTTFTEGTVSATPFTEKSVSATAWTEVSG